MKATDIGRRIVKGLLWRWDKIFVRSCRAILHTLVPSKSERYRLEKMVGPIGYWDQLRDYQFSFLKQQGLEAHHALLDLGCGPLQGGIPIIEYLKPGYYVGIDIRSLALEEAYKQVVKEGLVYKNPRLILSSNFGRDEIEGLEFDYVWIHQLLYHLKPEEIRKCFKQVSMHLKPGGKFFGDIIGCPNGIRPESRWEGYRFFLHTFEFLEQVSRQCNMRMKHLGQIKEFGYPETIGLATNDIFEFTKLCEAEL